MAELVITVAVSIMCASPIAIWLWASFRVFQGRRR